MSYYKKVIGIHGVPRSGTSWLAQIFNSEPTVRLKFQPLFCFAFKNMLDENSSFEEIKLFYNRIWENESDLFLNMKDPVIHKSYPDFRKSSEDILVFKQVHHHYVLSRLLMEDKYLKLILLIRNPLSILTSWKKAPKEFKPEWDFIKEWKYANLKNLGLKENYFGFEKWKEATSMFLSLKHTFPERIYLLEYGDLLNNTKPIVEKLFAFSGIDRVGEQTLKFIQESKLNNDNDPNSVFKYKVNDNKWLNELPKKVVDEILKDELFTDLNFKYNWI